MLGYPKYSAPAQQRNYASDPKTFYRCKNGTNNLYHHDQFGEAGFSHAAGGGRKVLNNEVCD